MILFLNFAPITFMGGAEKWMMDVAAFMKQYEPTTLMSVCANVSNIYGQLVSQRKFDTRARVPKETCSEKIDLSWSHFIPFSRNWKKVRTAFQNARVIYSKFEIMELIILLYFGGFPSLKKTIAGLHSPFLYYKPLRFLDNLHNAIYTSGFTKYFLQKMKKIHVINTRDKKFLEETFLLKHVVYIPNGVKIPSSLSSLCHSEPKSWLVQDHGCEESPVSKQEMLRLLPQHDRLGKFNKKNTKLHILFIGELSKRKGVDILIDVIKNSPDFLQFAITSDGPLREKVQQLALEKNNCTYHGYVSNAEKEALYQQADVLILPSRGEGFPLVILDALAHGLCIVDSRDIKLDLPEYVEYTSEHNDPKEYLTIVEKIYTIKQKTDFVAQKKRIFDYCVENFSEEVIYTKLKKKVFY